MDPPATTTATINSNEPSRKRQKLSESLKNAEDGEKVQNGAAALTEKRQALQGLLLDTISDNGVLSASIFDFVGSQGTAQCMLVCRSWAAAAKGNPSLWRNFVKKEFRLCVPDDSSSSNNMTSSIQQRSVTTPTNWPTAYRYLKRNYRSYKARVDDRSEESPTPLRGRVVFADDGGHFPGYPSKYALSPRNALVWCTSPGVDRNVDLVVELDVPSIITGFVIANGGRGYSAPLKEGLVFVSMDPPDLDAARIYDGENGSAWVKKIIGKGQVGVGQAKSCPSGSVPLAAVRFSNLSQSFDAISKPKLKTPIVGRYIHFKLLSSHLTAGFEGLSDNIDLMHCHTMGLPVGDLDLFVPSIGRAKPIPAYKPIHAIRPPAFVLEDREVAENQPLFARNHHYHHPYRFDDTEEEDDN